MSIEIRPRFEIEVPLSQNEILDRIESELSRDDAECTGEIVDQHVILEVHEEDRHYWSPQLTAEIEEIDDRSMLHCVLGPMPSVWTMFTTFYAFSFFIGFIGILWGVSQLMLGMTPYSLWLIPASAVMIAGAYIVAFAGKKLGHNQMVMLRSFLNKSLSIPGKH